MGTNLPVQSHPSEDAWENVKRNCESAIKVTMVAITVLIPPFRREKDVDEHFSRRHKILWFDIAKKQQQH